MLIPEIHMEWWMSMKDMALMVMIKTIVPGLFKPLNVAALL